MPLNEFLLNGYISTYLGLKYYNYSTRALVLCDVNGLLMSRGAKKPTVFSVFKPNQAEKDKSMSPLPSPPISFGS